jgi:GT2 family glycosyltransferase
MPPTVTIAICTKDRPDLLQRCLASCQAVRGDALEILVVDNDSAGDATRLAAESARVRYVHEPRPGLSAARNRAIAEAKGEVIAYTDDDCEVDRGWVTSLVERYADSNVGGVAGRTALPSSAKGIQRTIGRYSGGARGDRVLRVRRSDASWVFTRAIVGIGANMSFRREALLKAGGFPETFRSSGDDVYMFSAVLRAGFDLEYAPGAIVYQHHRDTLWRQARRSLFYGRQNAVVFAYIAAEMGSVSRFAFNVVREIAIRFYAMARAFWHGAPAQVLFVASGLAGLLAGTFTLPARLPSIRREIRVRRALASTLSVDRATGRV